MTIKDLLEQLQRQIIDFGAKSATLSGTVNGGWGFRVQVISPELWKEYQEAEKILDNQSKDNKENDR